MYRRLIVQSCSRSRYWRPRTRRCRLQWLQRLRQPWTCTASHFTAVTFRLIFRAGLASPSDRQRNKQSIPLSVITEPFHPVTERHELTRHPPQILSARSFGQKRKRRAQSREQSTACSYKLSRIYRGIVMFLHLLWINRRYMPMVSSYSMHCFKVLHTVLSFYP